MKNICVDLDGTIAEYDGWKGLEHIGDPIEGAQEFIKKLQEFSTVIIFTTRMNLDLNRKETFFDGIPLTNTATRRRKVHKLIWDWLVKHKFPEVIKIGIWAKEGKPIASAYVDDRAVVCNPQTTKLPIEMQFACAGVDCERLINQ